jgi:hypothetical protein
MINQDIKIYSGFQHTNRCEKDRSKSFKGKAK